MASARADARRSNAFTLAQGESRRVGGVFIGYCVFYDGNGKGQPAEGPMVHEPTLGVRVSTHGENAACEHGPSEETLYFGGPTAEARAAERAIAGKLITFESDEASPPALKVTVADHAPAPLGDDAAEQLMRTEATKRGFDPDESSRSEGVEIGMLYWHAKNWEGVLGRYTRHLYSLNAKGAGVVPPSPKFSRQKRPAVARSTIGAAARWPQRVVAVGIDGANDSPYETFALTVDLAGTLTCTRREDPLPAPLTPREVRDVVEVADRVWRERPDDPKNPGAKQHSWVVLVDGQDAFSRRADGEFAPGSAAHQLWERARTLCTASACSGAGHHAGQGATVHPTKCGRPPPPSNPNRMGPGGYEDTGPGSTATIDSVDGADALGGYFDFLSLVGYQSCEALKEARAKSASAIHGKVDVQLTLAADGSVVRAIASSATIAAPLLRALEKAATWQYDICPPAAGPQTVRVHMTLSSD
jgi:hypothetical protein